jgi:hypothetical protein
VEVPTDPLARNIVQLAGLLALFVGYWLIFFLNVPFAWRLLLALGWSADCLCSLWRLKQGAQALARLRLDSGGNVYVVDHAHSSQPVRLLSGSMVLPGMAWLRLRLADGSRHSELLIGRRVEAERWHRMQLIWQQCRESFGSWGRA